MSPALAGRFSTTVPPGKPGRQILNHWTTREVPAQLLLRAGFRGSCVQFILGGHVLIFFHWSLVQALWIQEKVS